VDAESGEPVAAVVTELVAVAVAVAVAVVAAVVAAVGAVGKERYVEQHIVVGHEPVD